MKLKARISWLMPCSCRVWAVLPSILWRWPARMPADSADGKRAAVDLRVGMQKTKTSGVKTSEVCWSSPVDLPCYSNSTSTHYLRWLFFGSSMYVYVKLAASILAALYHP